MALACLTCTSTCTFHSGPLHSMQQKRKTLTSDRLTAAAALSKPCCCPTAKPAAYPAAMSTEPLRPVPPKYGDADDGLAARLGLNVRPGELSPAGSGLAMEADLNAGGGLMLLSLIPAGQDSSRVTLSMLHHAAHPNLCMLSRAAHPRLP